MVVAKWIQCIRVTANVHNRSTKPFGGVKQRDNHAYVSSRRAMNHEDHLVLPTPEQFPAFPYDPPYSIQTDLMKHIYSSIERRHVTVVESPTGTVRAARDGHCL